MRVCWTSKATVPEGRSKGTVRRRHDGWLELLH